MGSASEVICLGKSVNQVLSEVLSDPPTVLSAPRMCCRLRGRQTQLHLHPLTLRRKVKMSGRLSSPTPLRSGTQTANSRRALSSVTHF
jgi:hypothetical protein